MTDTNFDSEQIIKDLHKQGISISKAEETALFLAYKKETNQQKKLLLKNKIIKANIRFAISESLKYKGIPGQDMSDIVAEALAGLTIAIDKFDLSKDVKFISYAVWFIKMRINKYLSGNDTIRIPTVQKSIYMKRRKSGEMPQDEEETNVYNILSGELSLDSPVCTTMEDGVHETLSDIIPDNSFVDGIDLQEKIDVSKLLVDDAINSLTKTQELVMRNYYGIGTDTALSLKNIGDSLGLSHERIRQIKNAAMRTIEKKLKASSLFREYNDKK